MLRLDPPIPLATPKGDAMAHVLIDYGIEHDLRWVCIVNKTGECWTFRNPEIRAWENITEGRISQEPDDHEAHLDIIRPAYVAMKRSQTNGSGVNSGDPHKSNTLGGGEDKSERTGEPRLTRKDISES